MELTKQQLQVLQHSIGADQYGCRVRGGDRNFFGTNRDGKDGQVCESLVALGFMYSRESCLCEGETIYHVTDDGIAAVVRCSPPMPKVSRSKQRYQQWLDSASDCYSFGEWLKMQKHRKFA